jgi:hypothetical protein
MRPIMAFAALGAAVVSMCLNVATAADVELQLEQSFGGEFVPAGTLKGELDGQVCLPKCR